MPIITNRAGIRYDSATEHLELSRTTDRVWYVNVVRCDGVIVTTHSFDDAPARRTLYRYPWDLVTAVADRDGVYTDRQLYGSNTIFCETHQEAHTPATIPMYCDNGRLMCRDGIPNRGTVEDLIGPRAPSWLIRINRGHQIRTERDVTAKDAPCDA